MWIWFLFYQIFSVSIHYRGTGSGSGATEHIGMIGSIRQAITMATKFYSPVKVPYGITRLQWVQYIVVIFDVLFCWLSAWIPNHLYHLSLHIVACYLFQAYIRLLFFLQCFCVRDSHQCGGLPHREKEEVGLTLNLVQGHGCFSLLDVVLPARSPVQSYSSLQPNFLSIWISWEWFGVHFTNA